MNECDMNEKIATNNSINNFCAIFLAVTSIINCLHFIFVCSIYALGVRYTNSDQTYGFNDEVRFTRV